MNIGSDNGLAPNRGKPLSEPNVAYMRHSASVSECRELQHNGYMDSYQSELYRPILSQLSNIYLFLVTYRIEYKTGISFTTKAHITQIVH